MNDVIQNLPERIEPLTKGYCGLVMTPYGIVADSNTEARWIEANSTDQGEWDPPDPDPPPVVF